MLTAPVQHFARTASFLHRNISSFLPLMFEYIEDNILKGNSSLCNLLLVLRGIPINWLHSESIAQRCASYWHHIKLNGTMWVLPTEKPGIILAVVGCNSARACCNTRVKQEKP